MKNKLTLLLLFWMVTYQFTAQNTYNDYYNQYLDGYNTNNLTKMKKGSEDLMTHFSDEFVGFYFNAYYQILKGDLVAAQNANNQAMNITITVNKNNKCLLKSKIPSIVILAGSCKEVCQKAGLSQNV